jgi:hypothetical protein
MLGEAGVSAQNVDCFTAKREAIVHPNIGHLTDALQASESKALLFLGGPE